MSSAALLLPTKLRQRPDLTHRCLLHRSLPPSSRSGPSPLLFFIYAPYSGRMKVLRILDVEINFMSAVIAGVMAGAHMHHLKRTIIGILCVIFGICMYASPLSVMKMVIETKSTEYMPFFLSQTLIITINGIGFVIVLL